MIGSWTIHVVPPSLLSITPELVFHLVSVQPHR